MEENFINNSAFIFTLYLWYDLQSNECMNSNFAAEGTDSGTKASITVLAQFS